MPNVTAHGPYPAPQLHLKGWTMAGVGESWVQMCPASIDRSTAILLTGNQEGNVNSILVVSVGGV